MLKALVVDSVKASLVMTSEALKDSVRGILVTTVSSGQECLDEIKNNSQSPFDIIVVDFDKKRASRVILLKDRCKVRNK